MASSSSSSSAAAATAAADAAPRRQITSLEDERHNLSLDTHTRGDLFAGAATIFADMNDRKDRMHHMRHLAPIRLQARNTPQEVVAVSLNPYEETDYIEIMQQQQQAQHLQLQQQQASRANRTPLYLTHATPAPSVLQYQEDDEND